MLSADTGPEVFPVAALDACFAAAPADEVSWVFGLEEREFSEEAPL
jgi:hypothetical protein